MSLKPRRRGRGTLPSAVGSKELFNVVEEMFSGKGMQVELSASAFFSYNFHFLVKLIWAAGSNNLVEEEERVWMVLVMM